MTAGILANGGLRGCNNLYIVYITTFHLLSLLLNCTFKFNPYFLHSKANLQSSGITLSMFLEALGTFRQWEDLYLLRLI